MTAPHYYHQPDQEVVDAVPMRRRQKGQIPARQMTALRWQVAHRHYHQRQQPMVLEGALEGAVAVTNLGQVQRILQGWLKGVILADPLLWFPGHVTCPGHALSHEEEGEEEGVSVASTQGTEIETTWRGRKLLLHDLGS